MLRILSALAAVAGIISTAMAVTLESDLPYALPASFPRVLLEADDCILPKNFSVFGLEMWFPGPNNPNNFTADFGYMDWNTNVSTLCHRNATSVEGEPRGYALRWDCENPLIQFIWQNTTGLTVLEKVCPNGGSRKGFEAAGNAMPDFICGNTTAASWPLGDGQNCMATDSPLNGTFYSLQPPPPSKFTVTEGSSPEAA